jgi:hypothetical protein
MKRPARIIRFGEGSPMRETMMRKRLPARSSWMPLIAVFTLGMPGSFADAASSLSKACAVEIGICLNYYTQEEEAERERIAALKAEIDLREHVHYSNGQISIYEGLFSTTTFPAETTNLSIFCGYDQGMEVVFENDGKSATVRIPMDEIVCGGIANKLGKTTEQLLRGE